MAANPAVAATVVASGVETFTASPAAFDRARHMARYSHRDWIVWEAPGGAWKAAKLVEATLEGAMAEAVGTEVKPGKFWCIGGDGVGMIYSPAIAAIRLGNLKAGY